MCRAEITDIAEARTFGGEAMSQVANAVPHRRTKEHSDDRGEITLEEVIGMVIRGWPQQHLLHNEVHKVVE
jgi:hypothetical protein